MYLLFDIGATKMRLAVSSDGRRLEKPDIIPTPKNFRAAITAFKSAARGLAGGKRFRAASGGSAGPFDKRKEKLLRVTNLPRWSHQPIKKELERAIGAPVFLENDTALAGLGEAHFGAGRGKGIVAYITVSTGVNGARIVDGRIDKTAFGFEIGRQIISFPREQALEDLISGKSVERLYGKKPYEITDKKFWDKSAKLLAYGLNNTILHWSPEIVILGGSMFKSIGIPIPRVRFHLKKVLKVFSSMPAIKKSALGDVGGLYGALTFLRQSLK